MSVRDSIVGAIQSGQMAVGNALAGGGGAVVSGAGGATVVLEDLRRISKKNEQNTGRLTDVLSKMFAFDKAKFARLRDQSREEEKEKSDIKQAMSYGPQLPGNSGKGSAGLGLKGLAAIAGLALFAKGMGANTDILKLPQQLKSIRAMATFAKGVGTIGTLGFGPQILKNIKFAIQSVEFKLPKLFTSTNTLLGESIKNIKTAIRGPLLGAQMQMTLLGKSIKESFNAFKLAIMKNKALKSIGGSIKGAMTSISATFEPVMNSLRSLFGGVKEGGALSKIITPLKAIAGVIKKVFLPLTLILGVFDGVAGFMKEYEETGSIVDGIRGAVVGIVDGFIGTFVRLITDLVGMALSYLGLEQLGASVIKFGEDITASFSKVIGGIVDVVTGLFTLDWERIKGGLGALFSGAGGFFMTVLTAPIDMAANFIRDIFSFGEPDKPFSLQQLITDTMVKVADWWNGLFEMPKMPSMFDMGRMMKALAAGGIAAVKAILPGGLSPGEAFTESYAASMKASQPVIVDEPLDLKGANKVIMADRVVTTEKTSVLNQSGSTTNGTTVVYNDQSNKQVSNQNYAKSETYTGSLNTGIDPYFDRASYNGA